MDWLWGNRKATARSSEIDATLTPETLLPPLENNTSSIRLLRIEESTGIENPVSCSLRTYRVEDAPPYTAISYAWGPKRGPDVNTLEIKINGILRPVRFNLYAFMQYASLRGSLRLWCQPFLWIDAICINQNDEVEKADQVSMMGHIYSTAYSVCAWLGPQPNSDDWSAWGSLWSWRKGPVYLPSAETTKDDKFWRRMWVVQEIKSARSLAFACGSRLVTAQQFKSTIGEKHGHCSWVFDSSLTKHRTSLIDWIMPFHYFECSNARDKIFAIQNLVTESQRIEVDYQLTFPEIYLLVLERQFGDLRERMFEEIKLLHVFLANFVVNLLDVKSMYLGEKYIRMATDQVSHLEARVESVVADTHLYHAETELKATWLSEKPYDYAFSYPYRLLGSTLDDYSASPCLRDVPGVKHHSPTPSSKASEHLSKAYTTTGPTIRSGLATAGVQRGDLICSISGFHRVLAVIRPFVYVPEGLAYGPLSEGSTRWIKPPLRDQEKLLFVPMVWDGKTEGKKMWLSYQIIGLALHTNEQHDSIPVPEVPATKDWSSNRHALHKQLIDLPVRLHLTQERVAALLSFANAYDDPSLSPKPMNLSRLRLVDDQKVFYVPDPTDPTGQKQLSSKFFDDPKNIIYKTMELLIAKDRKEREEKERNEVGSNEADTNKEETDEVDHEEEESDQEESNEK